MSTPPESRRVWAARVAVALVLASNLSAAIPYLLDPDHYGAAFELHGVAGAAMIRGLGVMFVMWTVAYLPLIVHPDRHPALFGVILAQQVIGLAGESLDPRFTPRRPCGARDQRYAFHCLRRCGARGALLLASPGVVRIRRCRPCAAGSVESATDGANALLLLKSEAVQEAIVHAPVLLASVKDGDFVEQPVVDEVETIVSSWKWSNSTQARSAAGCLIVEAEHIQTPKHVPWPPLGRPTAYPGEAGSWSGLADVPARCRHRLRQWIPSHPRRVAGRYSFIL